MAERAKKTTAVVTATLGSLAAPTAAEAMLPPDMGGPPPTTDDGPRDRPDPRPAAPTRPVQRDPAPAPAPTPVRDPVQRQQPVRQTEPRPQPRPQPQPERRVARSETPRTVAAPDQIDRQREARRPYTPPTVAAPDQIDRQREAQRPDTPRTVAAPDQIDRQREAQRPPTPPAVAVPDQIDRQRQAWRPATPATVAAPDQIDRQREAQRRTEPRPEPQPTPEPKPAAQPQPDRPTEAERVRSEAERYANALDQLEARDGAMNMGTSQAMALGDDPRVRNQAGQIRREEAEQAEAVRQRQVRQDRREAEDTRVMQQSRAYMNARERIQENGGALNMGLSRGLSYGQDPKVEAFVDEFDRQMEARDEEARRRAHDETVRRQAETYLNTLDQIEQRDGALSLGLSRNLDLGSDPEVKRVADRIGARREAAEERERVRGVAREYLDGDPAAPLPEDPQVREAVRDIERHRQTRADAERYAGALDQIDRNGGALNMGLSRTLNEFADDEDVKRMARDIRAEEANEYKEELFGPMDGPALRDPTLGQALPWPGEGRYASLTVEQKCMLQNNPNAALACAQGPKKPPVSVELSSSLTGKVSRGTPTLADNGETYETMSLSVDLRSTVKGQGRLPRGIDITLDHYNGKTLTYKLRVTSERADQIAAGDAPAPNPIDPTTIRTGESIILDKESYEGNSQSVTYHVLTGKLGFEEGRRLSSAVERLKNGRMRILVGDEEFVRHAVELRLGTEDLGVAAGVSREFATGDLRTVEVDPDREPGWDAYQHFVTSGELPEEEGPGIHDAASVDKASWSGSTTLELDAGPLHLGGSSNPYEGDVTETRHADGSVDYAFTDRQGGVTYIEQAKKDLGGKYGPGEYSLLLQDVDSNYVRGMTDLHRSDDADVDGDNQNVRLKFTEAELEQIRQDAIEQISYYTQQGDGDDGMTPAEVEEEAKKGYYDAQFNTPGGMHSIYLKGLATARWPGEVLTFMQSASHGNPTALVDELMRFQMLRVDEDGQAEEDTGSPPGSVEVFAD